jgi:threonine dehydrogenase-like Zn-dependent dehydrogenase
VELLESNVLDPHGLITHRRNLAGVREALELMANGTAMKVLITP